MSQINNSKYQDFLNQKNKIAASQIAQKEFLKQAKEQHLTKDFYEICKSLLIEKDKQNIKNLKSYLLSDSFQKYAYEHILKFNDLQIDESSNQTFYDNDNKDDDLNLY